MTKVMNQRNVLCCIGAMVPVSALAMALLCTPVPAKAEGAPQATAMASVDIMKVGMQDLEKVFWVCDYLAIHVSPEAVDPDRCGAAYQALKERKFGGDFDALVAWWRDSKAEQYARLAATYPAD